MTYPVSSPLWFRLSYPLRMYLRGFRDWDALNVWADARGWTHERLVDCICWLEAQGYASGTEAGWMGTRELPWAPSWMGAEGASQERLIETGPAATVVAASRPATTRHHQVSQLGLPI